MEWGRGCRGLFGGCCVLFGLPVLLIGLFFLWQAWQSNGWTTTTGVVLQSEMTTGDVSGDPVYGADLSYEYQVDGLTYQATRISVLDVKTGDEQRAQRFLERYPEGREVAVHYDPDRPDRAVLEPGVSGWTYFFAGVGLLLIGFGGFLVYRAILR